MFIANPTLDLDQSQMIGRLSRRMMKNAAMAMSIQFQIFTAFHPMTLVTLSNRLQRRTVEMWG